MATARFISPYESLIDFLVEKATPQEILAFQATDTEQERADELTEKNKSGTLTPDEREELKQMLEVDLLVGLLKARALESLAQP